MLVWPKWFRSNPFGSSFRLPSRDFGKCNKLEPEPFYGTVGQFFEAVASLAARLRFWLIAGPVLEQAMGSGHAAPLSNRAFCLPLQRV